MSSGRHILAERVPVEAIYLNHAGTSWPKPVDVQQAVVQAMSRSPSEWSQQFEISRQRLCNYFHISDPQQLLLTPGCTSALAVAIADLAWKPGDRVLISNWEHHGLHRPLLKLQQLGVQVETIPPEEQSPVDLSILNESLAAGRVKLVAMTAACNVTGEHLPVSDVIELAHRYNALVLIDAAQVVGWLDLNLSTYGADFVAFGGHKGLQAPWGIGGLFIADHVHMECTSAQCELSAQANGSKVSPRPGYCDVGSVDQFVLAGLGASLPWLQSQERENRLPLGQQLARHLRQQLETIPSVSLCRPGHVENALPTIALTVAGLPSTRVAKSLATHGLIVGSGMQCAPMAHQALGTELNGVVRISIGIGQSQAEIDEALQRFNFALKRGL